MVFYTCEQQRREIYWCSPLIHRLANTPNRTSIASRTSNDKHSCPRRSVFANFAGGALLAVPHAASG